jgi:serine-type D-Ala-D-Ala carboxypeptidase
MNRQPDNFMKHVDKLINEALSENVFPGSVLLVAKEDTILIEKAYGYANLFTRQEMTLETVFDLASLTKPLATTLATALLVQENRLSFSQRLSEVLSRFGSTDKAEITIRQLLSHTAGYPDYQPYYKALNRSAPAERSSALADLLIAEPLAHPVGQQAVYSDLGFMVLRWVVETLCGKRLDRFVTDRIYRPLGINDLFFVDLNKPRETGYLFAATEKCPWRKRVIQGAVHDDNAFVMGGIDGHAGLFGTAQAVFQLLTALLSDWCGTGETNLFDSDLLNRFFTRQTDSDRALGFDMPGRTGSSSGRFFSRRTVGHLGFTGTSFWMDLDRSVIVIFLTNRVHPTRTNEKIKTFRPKIHDAIMEDLAAHPVSIP